MVAPMGDNRAPPAVYDGCLSCLTVLEGYLRYGGTLGVLPIVGTKTFLLYFDGDLVSAIANFMCRPGKITFPQKQ